MQVWWKVQYEYNFFLCITPSTNMESYSSNYEKIVVETLIVSFSFLQQSTRRESRRSVSPARKRRSHWEPSLDSMPGSPRYCHSFRSRRYESRSLRRSRCRSPSYLRDRREQTRAEDYDKYYHYNGSNDRAQRGQSLLKRISFPINRRSKVLLISACNVLMIRLQGITN